MPQPEAPNVPALVIGPPVYLVLSEHGCWRCHKITPVISLGTERVDQETGYLDVDDEVAEEARELYVLSSIESLPADVLTIMQEYCPGYRHTYSRRAGLTYFMNHCLRCDAPLGDFFMHDEPGSAFFPETADECARLTLVELPDHMTLRLRCSYSVRSDGAFVLEHATKTRHRP